MDIEYMDTTDPERIVVGLRLADGTLHGCSFSRDTVEWRVAEYGLPMEDPTSIIEAVILEQFAPPAERGKGLKDAPDIDTARADWARRVGDVRKARPLTSKRTRGAADDLSDPMAFLVGACPVDPEAVAIKRELVKVGRERHRAPRDEQVHRIDMLRRELAIKKGITRK